MSANPIPQPVSYPRLRIGGIDFEFRYTQSAKMLIQAWGFNDPTRSVPAIAWAAAMAGFVDGNGRFRSAGFVKPTEFTDQLGDDDNLDPIYEAVTKALEKAAPKAKIALVPSPAQGTDTSTDQQSES